MFARALHLGKTAVLGTLLAVLASFVSVDAARAQVTSPGELSFVHEDWSGPGNCAQCHELGSRKTSDQRCLACHTPLAQRIEAREGYHADKAQNCASCHQEHGGPQARLVSFEPASFDHETIGYPLEGSHTNLDCTGCHNTRGVQDRDVRLFKGRYGALTRTFLGLSESCNDCHVSADPHAGQFEGRACASCHDETLWSPASRFDHANARYTLTGRHAAVACEGCHRETVTVEADAAVGGPSAGGAASTESLLYRPLSFGQCTSCHRDAHAGEMGAGCASCHTTAGWSRIPRGRFEGDFDHAATAFPLQGRHAYAECTSCHRSRAAGDPEIRLTFTDRSLRSYPKPEFTACGSCHLDYHDGVFEVGAFGAECATCHSDNGWSPSDFDVFKHEDSDFALTGAHRVTPCLDCHARPATTSVEADAHTGASDAGARPSFVIRLPEASCTSCHLEVDPHAGQFGSTTCESCHTTQSFRVDAFDHTRTRFPLDGAHEDVACASCHIPESTPEGETIRYRPLDTSCRSCHGEARSTYDQGDVR